MKKVKDRLIVPLYVTYCYHCWDLKWHSTKREARANGIIRKVGKRKFYFCNNDCFERFKVDNQVQEERAKLGVVIEDCSKKD